MSKYISISTLCVAALTLSACGGPSREEIQQSRLEAAEQACLAYGHKQGTANYNQCVAQEVKLAEQAAATRKAQSDADWVFIQNINRQMGNTYD